MALHMELGFAIRRRIAESWNNDRHPAFPRLLILSECGEHLLVRELGTYTNFVVGPATPPTFHGVQLVVDRRAPDYARPWWLLLTNAGYAEFGVRLERLLTPAQARSGPPTIR